MTNIPRSASAVAMFLLAGCYHATIDSGLTPSTQVIEQSFASSWIYGLVPPKTVSTTNRCPDGAAKVETELSFVNGLVGILTLGIYTPMHIRVTCAQGSAAAGAMLEVPADATVAAVQATFGSAATLAVASRQPVLVRYTK
jgi:Bor protein